MTEPQSGFTRVAAYGVITDADRMLLCRLSALVKGHAGRWTLPGGGIDFGEHPVDAMIREVREETGLVVEVKTLIGVDSSLGRGHDGAMLHSIRILYRAEVVGGQLTSEVDGSTDLSKWWARDDIDPAKLVDLAKLGMRLAFDEA